MSSIEYQIPPEDSEQMLASDAVTIDNIFNTKTPEKGDKSNVPKFVPEIVPIPKLQKKGTNEYPAQVEDPVTIDNIFNSKTPENAMLLNHGGKHGIPKLQKTPCFEYPAQVEDPEQMLASDAVTIDNIFNTKTPENVLKQKEDIKEDIKEDKRKLQKNVLN